MTMLASRYNFTAATPNCRAPLESVGRCPLCFAGLAAVLPSFAAGQALLRAALRHEGEFRFRRLHREQATALLRQQKKYHELFEVLKMQLRRKLGLPLLAGVAVGGEASGVAVGREADHGDSPSDSESLTDQQRTALEDGLIAACREVGAALLAEGKIREGWMYLRSVGDKVEAATLL